MLILKRADYEGKYHGFNLKEGFWYGTDTETGQYIATSGWETNGYVAIYHKEDDGKWEMNWRDIEETDFQLENIPEVDTSSKMPFNKWLLEEQDITWNEWDENYSGIAADQIEEVYDSYFYDGLPGFVRKYL